MISGLRASSTTILWAICATLAWHGSGGCSYVFVQTAKTEDGITQPGDCTSNVISPTIDSVLVGTDVMSAVYVAGEDHVRNKYLAVGAGLAVASIWLSSAIYGFYFTSECRSLRDGGPQGPYRRVRIRETVLSGPPAPLPPATPPVAPPAAYDKPAAAPAVNAGPAVPPAAPQQRDDDDPLHRRPGKLMAPK